MQSTSCCLQQLLHLVVMDVVRGIPSILQAVCCACIGVCWIQNCMMMVILVKSWLYLCRGEATIRQLVESMHRNMGGSHIIQVPPCVNAKIRANGHPHVLMPPDSPILHHQSCMTPAAVTYCLSCHTYWKWHFIAMSSFTGK